MDSENTLNGINGRVRMLITFVPILDGEPEEEKLRQISKEILKSYQTRSDLFVFKKHNRNEDIFITFKAFIPDNIEEIVHLDNTKFINWKPYTNTFYTINALNYLIMGETGEKDINHQVNWSMHRNKLIMLRNSKEIEGRKILSECNIKRYARISENGVLNYYRTYEEDHEYLPDLRRDNDDFRNENNDKW